MVVSPGAEILADDVARLSFFPVGTIMMYDASGWQDNITLKGWYKCAGQSVTLSSGQTRTMLNLTDYFVRGSSSCGTGLNHPALGNHERQLSSVPSHTHPASFTVSAESMEHSHTIPLSGVDDRNFSNVNFANGMMADDTGGATPYPPTTGYGGEHTHTISGNITLESIGSNEKFNIMPPCYKLIYIKKME